MSEKHDDIFKRALAGLGGQIDRGLTDLNREIMQNSDLPDMYLKKGNMVKVWHGYGGDRIEEADHFILKGTVDNVEGNLRPGEMRKKLFTILREETEAKWGYFEVVDTQKRIFTKIEFRKIGKLVERIS
jgi:hypothetical protein